MKFLLLVPFLLLLIVNPAFAFLSEDGTGLIKRFDVNVDGHIFEVITTSNYDREEHEFNKDEKRLTFFVNSSLENNLGEMVLPNELLGDNLTFYVNDVKSIQNVKSSEKISFITLNFTGIGNNKIDIIGTEIAETFDSQGGGCLIATATFDSEMSEQVQQLRELRDNSLLQTEYGTAFVKSFNQFYYSFSPFIADYERENVLFKEAIKITITPMLLSLSVLNYVDIDSEQTVFVMVEEFTHFRKSKPVILVAGLIWAIIGGVYASNGMPHAAEEALRHNILEYAELFLFLLVAMTYIEAMRERHVFEKLKVWLISRGFSFRQLFWLTGFLAFFISPIADNLTTALIMGAVVMAVGGGNTRFISIAFVNIVVAANAGGAFSPFGDITTLMVWQKGIVSFF